MNLQQGNTVRRVYSAVAFSQKPKYFYIKSELNGRVLDIEGENRAPGAKILMWDQKRGPTAANQLWYEDQQGILRSKLNEFSIDASGEGRTPK